MKKLIGIPILLLGALALAPHAAAGEAYLTRFGPMSFERGPGDPMPASATFNALAGPASLVLQRTGAVSAEIMVNGRMIAVDPADFGDSDKLALPLRLEAENRITVTMLGESGATDRYGGVQGPFPAR